MAVRASPRSQQGSLDISANLHRDDSRKLARSAPRPATRCSARRRVADGADAIAEAGSHRIRSFPASTPLSKCPSTRVGLALPIPLASVSTNWFGSLRNSRRRAGGVNQLGLTSRRPSECSGRIGSLSTVTSPIRSRTLAGRRPIAGRHPSLFRPTAAIRASTRVCVGPDLPGQQSRLSRIAPALRSVWTGEESLRPFGLFPLVDGTFCGAGGIEPSHSCRSAPAQNT